MNIPVDKQLHFFGGWAIAASILPLGIPAAIISVAVIAAAKEFLDSCGYGTAEPADFAATVAGGVIGSVAGSLAAFIA